MSPEKTEALMAATLNAEGADLVAPVVVPLERNPKTRRGWETTEFWLTLILAIGALVLTGLEKIDAETLVKVLGLGATGYSVARGLAKR